MDVDMFQDIKIRKLIKRQGGKAVTVYTLLLCFIYKNGYYIGGDEELPFLISEQTGFEEVYIQEVIKSCFSLGLFSSEMYERYQVITSGSIQARYQKICSDCKRVCKIDEYNLISSEETRIFSEEKAINSEETRINSERSAQSKVKKSKYIAGGDITRPRAREGVSKNDWFEELKQNQLFVEALAMQNGVSKERAVALIEAFASESLAKGIKHANYGDCRRHCYDWIRAHLSHCKNAHVSGDGKPSPVEVRWPTAEERRVENITKAAEERKRVEGIYESARKGNARMKAIVAEWARNGVLERYGLAWD